MQLSSTGQYNRNRTDADRNWSALAVPPDPCRWHNTAPTESVSEHRAELVRANAVAALSAKDRRAEIVMDVAANDDGGATVGSAAAPFPFAVALCTTCQL